MNLCVSGIMAVLSAEVSQCRAIRKRKLLHIWRKSGNESSLRMNEMVKYHRARCEQEGQSLPKMLSELKHKFSEAVRS